MEVQRNKRLNRLFIVLAVLVIALQIYQLIDVFIYNGVTNYFVDFLLKTVYVVLPILAITFRKHKAASVILSVVYLIITAYMDWSSLSYLISDIIRYGIGVYAVIRLGEIIINFAIGIFTLLNAVGKAQTRKVIAIVYFILVIIRISSLRIKKQGEVKNFCRSHPAGPRRIGLAQSSGKSTLPTKE